MNNFDKLNIECACYFSENMKNDLEEQFYIHLNSDYDSLLFTYGFTPFETFSTVLSSVKKPKRFIVFGSSTGYQLFFWNKIYPDVPAIGIELMSGRIDWGLEKMAEYDIDNVMMINGDLLDFEIQDGDLIWENNLLFDDKIIFEYNQYLLKNYDVQIVSYIDIELESDFIIDKNHIYQKIDCQSFKLKTSWMEDQDFFVYNKIKDEEILFTVDQIDSKTRIPEHLLNSYESMLLSKKSVESELFRNLFNKNNLKELFNQFGFNTPKTYLYVTEPTDFESVLVNYETYVAKPAHRSESVDVFIKTAEKKVDFSKISKRLNKSLKHSDYDFFRRVKIDGGVWWKNCEKGAIVEELIDKKYELKVFVVFGIPIIADLRTGSTEYDRVEFIKRENHYLNWSNEYEKIQRLSEFLKIDFFRIDFLYDGEKLWASEMAVMPGTDLPENIQELIHRNWVRPYIKFYYPQFVI